LLFGPSVFFFSLPSCARFLAVFLSLFRTHQENKLVFHFSLPFSFKRAAPLPPSIFHSDGSFPNLSLLFLTLDRAAVTSFPLLILYFLCVCLSINLPSPSGLITAKVLGFCNFSSPCKLLLRLCATTIPLFIPTCSFPRPIFSLLTRDGGFSG